jgi:mannose-6-phosphate isomerase-like protein (cupin superfamily)
VKNVDVKEVVRVKEASVRRLSDQEEWRSICGTRRDLANDPAEPANFHYMRIKDSRKHYHLRTTEYYFVVEGEGEMDLDERTIPIKKGDLIHVPPGTRHTSRPTGGAELHILIVAVPPFRPEEPDHHFPDEPKPGTC